MDKITKLADFDFKSRWLSTDLDKGISKPSLPARFIYRAFEKIGLSNKYNLQKINSELEGYITRAKPTTNKHEIAITTLIANLEGFQSGHANLKMPFSSSITKLTSLQKRFLPKTAPKKTRNAEKTTRSRKRTRHHKTRHAKGKENQNPNGIVNKRAELIADHVTKFENALIKRDISKQQRNSIVDMYENAKKRI